MNECARMVPADSHLVWLDLGGRVFSAEALYSQLRRVLSGTILESGDIQQDLINLLNEDRKSVVKGKGVSVRVDHGCSRLIKKTKHKKNVMHGMKKNTQKTTAETIDKLQ